MQNLRKGWKLQHIELSLLADHAIVADGHHTIRESANFKMLNAITVVNEDMHASYYFVSLPRNARHAETSQHRQQNFTTKLQYNDMSLLQVVLSQREMTSVFHFTL